MAMFEARVLLRTILQEVTLVPEATADEDHVAHTVLLLPKRGGTVTLRTRAEAAAES